MQLELPVERPGSGTGFKRWTPPNSLSPLHALPRATGHPRAPVTEDQAPSPQTLSSAGPPSLGARLRSQLGFVGVPGAQREMQVSLPGGRAVPSEGTSQYRGLTSLSHVTCVDFRLHAASSRALG